MALFKVSKTIHSAARSKHRTYEAAKKARAKIPGMEKYYYYIYMWRKISNRWEKYYLK